MARIKHSPHCRTQIKSSFYSSLPTANQTVSLCSEGFNVEKADLLMSDMFQGSCVVCYYPESLCSSALWGLKEAKSDNREASVPFLWIQKKELRECHKYAAREVYDRLHARVCPVFVASKALFLLSQSLSVFTASYTFLTHNYIKHQKGETTCLKTTFE